MSIYNIYIYIYTYIYIYIYIYMSIYNIYTYIYIYVHIYIIYMYIYVHICVCIYIHNRWTHIYVISKRWTHIYIYFHPRTAASRIFTTGRILFYECYKFWKIADTSFRISSITNSMKSQTRRFVLPLHFSTGLTKKFKFPEIVRPPPSLGGYIYIYIYIYI